MNNQSHCNLVHRQAMEQGGWFSRAVKAAVTGGASEIARAAKSKKGRKALAAIATGGASLIGSKSGRRGLAAILTGGASEVLANKKARRAMHGILTGGASEIFRNKKARRAFLTGGLSVLPKRAQSAILTGGGSELASLLGSKKARKAFLTGGLSLLTAEATSKKSAKKAPRPSRQQKTHLSKAGRRGTFSRKQVAKLPYTSRTERSLHEWIPHFLRMSTQMRSIAHRGLLGLLSDHWGVETGDPFGPDTAFLLEDVAQRLNRMTPDALDEAGNPTWHSESLSTAISETLSDFVQDIMSGVTSPSQTTVSIKPESISELSVVSTPLTPTVTEPQSPPSSASAFVPSPEPTQSSVPPLASTPAVVAGTSLPSGAITTEPEKANETASWRRDIYKAMTNIASSGPYKRGLKDPRPVFAMALTEAGPSPTTPDAAPSPSAVNRDDGYYKPWSRTASSVGFFQIREPTALYLHKNRMKIGSYGASQLAALPADPQNNRSAMITALKKYPSQIYYGLVLYALGMRWIDANFVFDANGRITSTKSSKDAKLASFVNKRVAPGVPGWAILLRLYWAASSKAGPRTLVKKGIAEKVVDSRFLKFLRREPPFSG